MARRSAVQFPIYREYEHKRQDANNAIVALLAGSTLAVHTLQLTEGSTRLLPEIFPAVPHISRFNLRPDGAAEILRNAGSHLAVVTMPYALAIHEDFVMKCIGWLRSDLKLGAAGTSQIDSSNMHDSLAAIVGSTYDASTGAKLEIFHLFRLMRNCHIHRGGAVTKVLREHISGMSSLARSRWFDLTHREPAKIEQSGQAEYSLFDIFAVFAVSKDLARAVNDVLHGGLSRALWAETCIRDFQSQTSRQPRSNSWGRGLVGYATHRYGSLHLTQDELFAAAAQMGVWPDSTRRP